MAAVAAIGLVGTLFSVMPATFAATGWTATGSMHTTRAGFASVLLKSGKVLVIGGSGTLGVVLGSAEIYDPAGGTWATTGSLTTARWYATATLLNDGRVLVTGGEGASPSVPGPTLASAEIYDPSAGTWSPAGNMSTPRKQHTATLLPSGKVLVAAGCCDIATGGSSELYDPVSGTWSSSGATQDWRFWHTATLLQSGKVLITGGLGFYTEEYKTAELYDPATGLWARTGLMLSTRHNHTATLLADGRVVVVGGKSFGYKTSEIYDPGLATWSATGSPVQGHYDHTATRLADGTVLVAGGYSDYVQGGVPIDLITDRAEIYNPGTSTWASTANMTDVRDGHTASLLNDGRVLVAGGLDYSHTTLSAELYAGPAAAPQVNFNVPGLDYSSQAVGSTTAAKTVTVKNTGNADLHVQIVSIGGADRSDFAITGDTCSATTVVPNGTCTASAMFTPIGTGNRSASLMFADDAAGSPQSVALSGSGTGSPQAVLPAMSNGAYGGYVTVAYVENVGSSPTFVSLQYFDPAGGATGAGNVTRALAPGATWAVHQDDGNGLHAGAAGSAAIFATGAIAAFVNEFAPGAVGDATSYTGIAAASAAPTLFAPAIANGAYGGYTTGIGLINLGAAPTNLTVNYRDAGGGIIKTQSINGVAAGAYRDIYSGDAGLALPAGFAGTATIQSSSGPIAAVVNEAGPGGQFSSYDAVPAGSTILFAPAALNNAYGGYSTGMAVQNTTGSAGTVTIDYYDTGGTATTKTFSIAANGYLGVYQGSPTDGPAVGAYTAKLTSTVAIAAVVNEVAPSSTSAKQSTAYNTFASGAASIHLPLVESAGSDGWSTGEGIMNTGTAATTVTVTYYNTVTGAQLGTPQSLSLQPNAFWGLYQPAGGLPNGMRASAVVTTAAGGQVAVICNESSATTFMSYSGQ